MRFNIFYHIISQRWYHNCENINLFITNQLVVIEQHEKLFFAFLHFRLIVFQFELDLPIEVKAGHIGTYEMHNVSRINIL